MEKTTDMKADVPVRVAISCIALDLFTFDQFNRKIYIEIRIFNCEYSFHFKFTKINDLCVCCWRVIYCNVLFFHNV